MAGFAEILGGIGQAMREDRIREQEQGEKRSNSIADLLMKQAEDDNLTPQEQAQSRQAALRILQTGKVGKQDEQMLVDSVLRMNMPAPPATQAPMPQAGDAAAAEPYQPVLEAPPGSGRGPTVGDIKAEREAKAQEKKIRLVASINESLAKTKEESERARRQKELTELDPTGEKFNAVQRANFLRGHRLEEFAPGTQVKTTLQRFEGALADAPGKKVIVTWDPKENVFKVGGAVVPSDQVLPPPDVGSLDSVPAQERRDALEAYAGRAGKTIDQLSPGERIQAVVDYKAQTAPVFSSTGFALVPQTDGSIRAVPMSRTSQRAYPGASPSLPVPPGGGGTASPMPQAAKPKLPSAGAGAPGRVVGGRELSPEVQKIKANAESGLKALTRLDREIKKDSGSLAKAALPFSPGARILETARNEIKDVLQRLRTGAAINDQEMDFYGKQMPSALDSDETIEYKLGLYRDLFTRLRSGVAATEPSAGGGLTPPPAAAGGVPQVGQTFEGKRVTKVTKVK
jgi:hypothetical protein